MLKNLFLTLLLTLTAFLDIHAQEGRAVVIRTPIEGARVFIDGKEVGTSPHRCFLSIDSHWIYAMQDGDISETARIKVTRGKGALPDMMLKFHAYVDLALPSGTLWATCNVGADKPEDHGSYFAWSETKPVTASTTESYEYKSELLPKDDAAFVIWGSDWCMPTLEQLKELTDARFTIPTQTTREGVKGLLLTSRKNGNTLFLPAAGYSMDGKVEDENGVGYYWSQTKGDTYLNAAYQLYFMDNDAFTNSCDRFYGRSIRPVRAR